MTIIELENSFNTHVRSLQDHFLVLKEELLKAAKEKEDLKTDLAKAKAAEDYKGPGA